MKHNISTIFLVNLFFFTYYLVIQILHTKLFHNCENKIIQRHVTYFEIKKLNLLNEKKKKC